MIAIIKYNAGNIRSVQNALQRLGCTAVITDDHEEILNAGKVIFPGVGEAASAMKYLREKNLDTLIISLKQPVLGICLGLQLMCRHSEEGDTTCLGIFPSDVRLFPPADKVPHMGWNNLITVKGPLLNGISPDENLYFVHSYYAETGPCTTAVCEYIVPFSAAMQKDNFYATQFHPEKSAGPGEKILKNFIEL
ncbi:MAG: imidazole glycerol phosphate synthase subunit HisH [Bacteroidales bacterium]|nr:imidazole glycerol phosphate synthase subunit HisH [Bacteroidales bacterium]MBN2633426.1 imidazole glycerol phosphate synthase subunit HisH [Bacteroidales bacterium]